MKTFMGDVQTHGELVARAGFWLQGSANCGVVLTELVCNTASGESPDAIGFRNGGVSILIECKVSRSDFLADQKKRFRKHPELGMGLFRFYLCPPGIIDPNELPHRWGLLYTGGGQAVERIAGGPRGNIWNDRASDCFVDRNIGAEWDLLYSALRRRK